MTFLRSVLWDNPHDHSREYFILSYNNEGYSLKGTVITLNEKPTLVNYEIHCSTNWLTRSVQIRKESEATTKGLTLKINNDQNWFSEGSPMESMKDLFDIDLDFSPATNTIHIRRLNLDVGESRVVDAVWVRLEGLTFERLTQKYARIDESHYEYENPSGFRAVLEVDELGLIVRYGEIWRRIL